MKELLSSCKEPNEGILNQFNFLTFFTTAQQPIQKCGKSRHWKFFRLGLSANMQKAKGTKNSNML